MMTFLALVYVLLILQRLTELKLAQSNRKWLLERGGIEIGNSHYYLFVLLHCAFFLCLGLEFLWTEFSVTPFFRIALCFIIVLQVMRIWCLKTLGRRWNTRIIVLPNDQPIKKGLYKYLKHPNYVIVFFELLMVPLLFHAYMSAVIFPFLHLLILKVRIPLEEKAVYEKI